MTTSTHTYTAVSGGVALSIRAGSGFKLDASTVPHVQGTLTIARPSLAVLASLDPRMSPAPRVMVTASAGGIPRTFDLHVRDWDLEHGPATVSLTLASDEGLLQDYAPLADDGTPFTVASSLRGICNYVLRTAIAHRRNLIPNPSGRVNLTGYSVLGAGALALDGSSGAYVSTAVAGQGAGDYGIRVAVLHVGSDIAPNTEYTYSALAYAATTVVQGTFLIVNGSGVSSAGWGQFPPASGYTRRAVTFTTGASGDVYVYMCGTFTTVAGSTNVVAFADATVEASATFNADAPYFDGSTAPAANTQHVWEGAPHLSVSRMSPALASAPSVDADLTPYWPVTNLMPNPALRSVLGNWLAGGSNGTLGREAGHPAGSIPAGADVTTAGLTTWTGNSGLGTGGAFAGTATVAPYVTCKPHTTYTISVYMHTTTAKTVVLQSQIFGADGQILEPGAGAVAVTQAVPANTWTRLVGTIKTGANAARLGPMLYAAPGSQWTAGTLLRTTAWMVHEGAWPVPVPYFDGATPNDARYTYTISGAANASASTRNPVMERSPEALTWKAGQSAMDFLHPLVQAAGMRLVCDEGREWTLRDENYTVAGSLNLRLGVNLTDAAEKIARAAGYWFDARVTRYRWVDTDGIQQERIDAYALTPTYTRLTLLDVAAPYPGPGRSEYAVRRAQGVGREVSVSLVSDWTAKAEMPASVQLDGAQLGKTQSVTYGLDNDRMTITTRTRDIPSGAIDLLTGTTNALTGTINNL